MQLANEAYHLNMSACLTADKQYKMYDVAVNTIYPKFFNELIDKRYNKAEKNSEIVERIPLIREIKLPFKLIPEDKDLIIEITNDGTEINRLKQDYLLCKNKLLKLGDEASIKEYNSVAEEYERKIIEHVSSRKKESLETITSRVVKVVSFVSIFLTFIPHIAVRIIGVVVSGGLSLYNKKVVETVSGSICDIKMKKLKSCSIMRVNKYISEMIDKKKAKRHSKILPIFNA